jgi:hypothetical protein
MLILLLLGVWTPAVAQVCDPAATMQTTQPKPRPDFVPDRQALFVRSLASGSYGTIALGDSILAGWQPRRLQDLFGRPTLSISFGGDGTEHILWRLQTLDWSGQNPQ